MADVATPSAAANGQDPAPARTRREKNAADVDGKSMAKEVLAADEFTKATFTAAQKVLREQRYATTLAIGACVELLQTFCALRCRQLF